MVTSLVLSFIICHLHWRGCRFVPLESKGKDIQLKDIWGQFSDIKGSGIFPRFLFHPPESRWAVNIF